VGVDVIVVPGTTRFDPDDPGWRDQVATLYTALREEVAQPSVHSAVVPNAKGTLDTVVIALGSSGALTAVVACFRAWLARDKTRTVTITWTDDSGTEQRITLTGENIDRAALQALANAISGRFGSR
jgi:hypothetical protein